ncbi:MAG: hypothetical protein WBY53_04575 [Acidobacteriaceae bacterium]
MATTAGAVGSRAPVRGTQSFVGVMTEVWKRPSLTGLEVLWRWVAGAPILALMAWRIRIASAAVHVDGSALGSMTVFKPVAAFATMHAAWAAVLPAAKPVVMWLLPLAAVLWVVVAALGRTAVMRRFDKTMHARRGTLLVLGLLRAALLTGAWAVLVGVVWWAGAVAIIGPAKSGGDPDIVLYSAILICGSLLMYVLWAVVSWPFQLAPLLAMQENVGAGASLKLALRSKGARGKLIEVNLVMTIAKLAVLVLAMVLSASPLAFASANDVVSPVFLREWWAGVILLYMVALDYFHVVQTVAHLRLWRACDFSDLERPQG